MGALTQYGHSAGLSGKDRGFSQGLMKQIIHVLVWEEMCILFHDSHSLEERL